MSPLVISVIYLLFMSQECRSGTSEFYRQFYIGCYADIKYAQRGEKHDLEETAIAYREENIIKPCIETCRKRGYLYAGARVSVCYCGDRYGTMGEGRLLDCFGCAGSEYLCGGDLYNAVYRVCPFGQFGDDCSKFCHCQNTDRPCATLTGSCPEGGCVHGWVTESCSIRDKCIDQFGCEHGGTCKPDRFGVNYMCVCPPQCTGLHCEIVCPIGYYGEDCENICRCRFGSCNIISGICDRVCRLGNPNDCDGECKLGFFGPRCDNFNPCVSKPCKNNGICHSKEGAIGCTCSQPFFGHRCEFDTRQSAAENRFAVMPSAMRYKQMLEFSAFQVKRMAKGKMRSYTYEYIGCYRDQDIDRDLDGDLWIDDDMGPGPCSRHCLRKGFTFSGIQAGTDCRCGNAFGRHGIVPNRECDIVCAAEPLQKCGAEDLNSIYSVCPAGSYEPSCKPICNCLADMHCDLMTGACPNQLCKQGWTGTACNEGIVYDERQFYTKTLIKCLGAYVILAAAWTIWTGYQWKKSKSFKTARFKLKKEYMESVV